MVFNQKINFIYLEKNPGGGNLSPCFERQKIAAAGKLKAK